MKIFTPNHTVIDIDLAYMITIGNNVNITGPVTILCHDYSTIACRELVGGVTGLGNIRPVNIGNNVFIGWGATILAGSHIGDNTIIGAGAVVTGRVENNSVVSGNPAKKIMSIQEFLHKRGEEQLQEAVNIYKNYQNRFGKDPDISLFGNYKNVFDCNVTGIAKNSFCSYEEFKHYVNEKF